MIRDQLSDALKTSMKEKKQVAVSTLRLIQAAIKDRDIAARSKGVDDGSRRESCGMQTMVRQRHVYRDVQKGNRDELAEREAQRSRSSGFMPRQLDDAEMETAIDQVVEATGAASIKDMGKAMGALRERYAGQMDFGKAGAALKARLAG